MTAAIENLAQGLLGAADPIACPKCGSATARTFRPRDGGRAPYLRCTGCGATVRELPLPGCGVPSYVFEPRPADAHAVELRPPPPSWVWVGYVRPTGGRWFAVALTSTLESCWDALLTTHMRGDLLAVPVKPPRVHLELEGDDAGETQAMEGFVGWHRTEPGKEWVAVVEAADEGDCWNELL